VPSSGREDARHERSTTTTQLAFECIHVLLFLRSGTAMLVEPFFVLTKHRYFRISEEDLRALPRIRGFLSRGEVYFAPASPNLRKN
jgi:hypothetical protein